MNHRFLFFLLISALFSRAEAQTCLPGGLTFTSQSQINNFSTN